MSNADWNLLVIAIMLLFIYSGVLGVARELRDIRRAIESASARTGDHSSSQNPLLPRPDGPATRE